MAYLKFPLFLGRYVNRWLVSGIAQTPVHFTPVTLHGDINLWLKKGFSVHENPCKTEFVRARRARPAALPPVCEPVPGGRVGDGASPQTFAVYWPFDDISLDISGGWDAPTHIRAWAYTELWADEDGPAPFLFTTCGGAAVWLNGEKVLEFTPFTRNIPADTPLELTLRKGRNSVLVFFDDLAERDAAFLLRLCWQGTDAPPEQRVPVGAADPTLLEQGEQAMRSLCFSRNHYAAGPVSLRCENPFAQQTLHVTLEGATEENEQAGVLFTRTADFAPGQTRASLGDCAEFPFGFLLLQATAVVEGIAITRPITVETHASALLPHAADTVAGRKRQALEFLARFGEQNTNRAVALLATGGSPDEAQRLIAAQVRFVDRRCDCSDFYLVYFPHILRAWGAQGAGLLSPELERAMRACILNFRYWMDEPGDDVMWFYSENHALMFHTCQLLAGELYPSETFSNSGMTGVQMQQKAKGLLLEWFRGFLNEGFTEWNSSAYLPIDLLGLASLYAWTQDGELRALAKRGMDYVFYLLAVHSRKGFFAGSSGRTYLKEQFGNWSNCTSFMSWIGYGCGTPGHAGKGVVSLCLSDYEPPRGYAAYFNVEPGFELVCRSTHGYQKHVDLYTYKTSGYLMTSAADFRPGKPGYQENPLQLTFTPTAQLWISHPGERALYGKGRPSYWAGNGTLPRVNQYKGFATVFYDIAPEHPVDFTHLYLPTMEFYLCRVQGPWVFAQEGDAYCAVYCSAGLTAQRFGPNAEREFIAPGRRCVWLVRAAQTDEFPSFAAFITAMLAAPLEVDAQRLACRFEDPVYGVLRSGWNERLSVNGAAMEYGGSDQYGVLELREKQQPAADAQA